MNAEKAATDLRIGDQARWRPATDPDAGAIVAMSVALNAGDPGPSPVPEAHVVRTLRMFREEPWRGRAVVLADAETLHGYAFLVSFWSNELGGEVCTIDELYVAPHARGRGRAGSLLELLFDGILWSPRPVALELETTPNNRMARKLYERHGFVGKNLCMRRLP